MNEQRLIWTLLPRGLSPDGSAFRFSAFVTPRLLSDHGSPTLSLFPDWIDWPATVRAMTFSLVPAGRPTIPATVVSAPPDSAAWQRLFAQSARVESFVWKSYALRKIWSYPAAKVRDYVTATYGTMLATYPTSVPPNRDLVGYHSGDINDPVPPGLLGAISFGQRYPASKGQQAGPDSEDQAFSEIDKAMGGNFAIPPNFTWQFGTPGRYELLQAKLFHQSRTPIAPGTTTADLTPTTPPVLDFHQVVSLLGDHAALQRLFGLVIDLEAPVGDVAAKGHFALGVSWTSQLGHSHTKAAFPRTITGTNFLAGSRTSSSQVKNGMLQLQRSTFSTVEFDADGATRKLLTTARVLWNRAQGYLTTPGTADTSTIAALRSAGIGVAWEGLAFQLAQAGSGTLAFQDELDSLLNGGHAYITLGAEDLTRGWRVDVFDKGTTRWYQLCARKAGASGGFLIGDPAGSPVPVPAGDEGFVQLAPTSDATGASPDLYLQEVIFRWNGWSLIAPRPGGQLDADPTAANPVVPDPGNPASPDFPISITYAATPGTLPRLRFGRSYRFRARAVDVAGNSVPFDPAATGASLATASNEVTYRRMEPVASPQMLMRAPVTAGESVEILVIRSNFDIPDGSVAPTERHVVPPPFSELLAEEHGLLDAASGLPDPHAYKMLAGRDGSTFAGGTVDPVNRGVEFYTRSNLGVPYLPDVLARGTAFAGLPGAAAGSVLKVPGASTSGPWPNARSVRLVVTAGSGAPVAPSPADGAALTVAVPKGTQVPVTVSSYLDATDLGVMAVWQWTPAAFRNLAANRHAAADGAMWMLTPNRSLLLVHAVRQPNIAPVVGADFVAVRNNLGDTIAEVIGTVGVDSNSTDRVDILADWSEPVDDGTNPDPVTPQPFSADLGRVTVADDGANSVAVGTVKDPMVQHFGNTKRHDVSYQALATTRYAKYFTEAALVTLHGSAAVDLPNLLGLGVAPGTVAIDGATGTPTYTEGTDYSVDYAAGTVARIPAGAIGNGAQVQAAYVPAPITRSSLENEPGGRAISIPNSANPIRPVVRSVLPAWAFDTASAHSKETSTRRGGLLRVYLDRPWWSSGPGELLGVVLDADSNDTITSYGRDPMHPNGTVNSQLRRTDFPLATQFPSGTLRLPDGRGPVDVAGHPVSFDAARNLWFADLLITPLAGAYFPFVQLVLARYQPGSLQYAELSSSVILDMAQAVPNRVVVADLTGVDQSQASSVKLHVTGPVGPGPYGQPNVVRAVVQVQSGGTDELNWTDTAPAVKLHLSSGGAPIGQWRGPVTRPAGAGPYRVLVTEVEQYYRGPSAPGSSTPGGGIGERLVYADTLAL